MLSIRRSADRGQADHGWLRSQHSFSFAEYFDPEHIEFGALRVINEDRVAPGMGFGTHGHRDMEIVTYVLEGALQHRDSMGNGSVMRPGDIQRMSAGTGVMHSEFNASKTEPVHFLQIWIQPAERGTAPSYEQKHFAADQKRGRLRLLASQDGATDSLRIQQNARLYAGLFDGAERAQLALAADRMAYVHVVRGTVQVNGVALSGGDAAKLRGVATVDIQAGQNAEVIVFDLTKE
jgi:hypothetical protein